MQEDVGLKVVTDGEFRRGSYWDGLSNGSRALRSNPRYLTSATITATRWYSQRPTRNASCSANSRWRSRVRVPARRHKGDAESTLPAPSTMHFYRCTDFASRDAYADVEAFFADLTRIFREEVTGLIKAGCRYIQLTK